jgi:hypothetical protein
MPSSARAARLSRSTVSCVQVTAATFCRNPPETTRDCRLLLCAAVAPLRGGDHSGPEGREFDPRRRRFSLHKFDNTETRVRTTSWGECGLLCVCTHDLIQITVAARQEM